MWIEDPSWQLPMDYNCLWYARAHSALRRNFQLCQIDVIGLSSNLGTPSPHSDWPAHTGGCAMSFGRHFIFWVLKQTSCFCCRKFKSRLVVMSYVSPKTSVIANGVLECKEMLQSETVCHLLKSVIMRLTITINSKTHFQTQGQD